MLKCGFNKVEITLQHECSPVNLLHIFKIPFPNTTCRGLLLHNYEGAETDSQFDLLV